MAMQYGSQAYQSTGQASEAFSADPSQLITMLFDGAIDRITVSKAALERGDFALKGMLISKAITIIDGLRAHLDMERGGDIAKNLSDIYIYAENRLFEANFHNDLKMLDEVIGLIQNIREGWIQIYP
ncbi:MAG: flagellar export chaperone FliS [Pseudomonadota bacterium]